jgi:hypothetical protein
MPPTSLRICAYREERQGTVRSRLVADGRAFISSLQDEELY